MTARFRISIMVVTLAGLVALGSAPPAEAAFRLTLVDDASNTLNIDDLNQVLPAPQPSDRDYDVPNLISYRTSPGPAFGGFNINVSATSNGPGTVTGGNLTESVLVLSNVAAVTRTLTIIIEDDVDPALFGFNQPAGPPVLMTGVLGGPASTITSPTFLLTMQSELIPQVGSAVNLGTPLTTSLKTIGDERSVLVNRAAPYDLRQTVTITLAAGENLTFTASTFVAAVPEPSTIVVAGMGAVLSLGALRRRTRA